MFAKRTDKNAEIYTCRMLKKLMKYREIKT